MVQDLRQFTYAEVLASGCPAWTESNGCAYHYDGIRVWITEWEQTVPKGLAPKRGWRHRETCDCPLCMSGPPQMAQPD
jgi:hypothetical protein